MQNWLDEIIECTLNNFNNREIVIWGSNKTAETISNRLKKEYDLKTAFFVDSNSQLVDNYYVKNKNILKDCAYKYYVIVPLAYYPIIKNDLTNWGYTKDKDYCYWTDCVITDTEDYYEDAHGNKLFGYHYNLNFMFCGYGGTVKIESAIRNPQLFKLYLHNNSTLEVGSNNQLSGTITINDDSIMKIGSGNVIAVSESICIDKKAEVIICDNNTLKLRFFRINYGGRVYIRNRNTFNPGTIIHCTPDTLISINNDCMFSTDVILQSNDGHSIFDVVSGENINSIPEISSQRKIIIEDHVWIGRRCTVLYNSIIKSGSIIGANSVVKSTVPNNCIAVGTPSRVVRKNIAWSRKYVTDNISDCGEEYVNITEEE